MTGHTEAGPRVKWEDPPDRMDGWRYGRWPAIVDELRASPGRWALVKVSGSKDGSQSIRKYLMKRYGLEVITRKQADDAFSVYARWPSES